ncbi:hypothetical protein [Argonema galeatum]|uniref:hypothetical protein n=1 Tax=Argonema galeatum TaxID=2942762 RepID=UPI00201272D8|nr:hypothetical protein [Argonema galeatum]MCL1465140.1 hypothetical protein [Argonema galeatum A003/A1]
MSYSNFTLSSVIKQFSLTLKDKNDLFFDVGEIKPSEYLEFTLKYNLPLAGEIQRKPL